MPIDVRGMAPLLEVFDMATSLAFYRDVLGFEVVSTSGEPDPDHWALLRLNGVELMLDSAYEPDQRPPPPTRRAWPATTTPRCTSAARTWMRRTPTCARTASRRRSRTSRRTG